MRCGKGLRRMNHLPHLFIDINLFNNPQVPKANSDLPNSRMVTCPSTYLHRHRCGRAPATWGDHSAPAGPRCGTPQATITRQWGFLPNDARGAPHPHLARATVRTLLHMECDIIYIYNVLRLIRLIRCEFTARVPGGYGGIPSPPPARPAGGYGGMLKSRFG